MTAYDIVVVGGGTAGLLAAAEAAMLAPDKKIAILEKQDRVGRKLLSTGNGRCNLTNMHITQANYHGSPSFAMQVIDSCPPEEIREIFDSEFGLRTTAEDTGLVYPLCGQAAAVLDSIRITCRERNVQEVCSSGVKEIQPCKDGFLLILQDDSKVRCRKVILCTGGMAAPKLGGTDAGVKMLEKLGHHAVPRHPALTQIDTDANAVRALKGQRCRGTVSLVCGGKTLRSERGEILFNDSSLSGIAVMQLSAQAGQLISKKNKVSIVLQLLDDDPREVLACLRNRMQQRENTPIGDLLTGLTAKRIGQSLCKAAGIKNLEESCSTLEEKDLRAIAELLVRWEFPATGIKGFDTAQVTAGGIKTEEFDPKTMESLVVPGLYAAGEVLNIDGDCGGYNLTWAWASGLTAGKSAACSLIKGDKRH